MSLYYIGSLQCDANYLKHHGILGQKWGKRRFQNEDGSLTPEGRARYLQERTSSSGQKYYELSKKGFKRFRKGTDGVNDKDLDMARENEAFKNHVFASSNESSFVAAHNFNSRLQDINNKFEKKYGKEAFKTDKYTKYIGQEWKKTMGSQLLKDFGEHPTLGKKWVNDHPFMTMFDEDSKYQITYRVRK